MRIYISGKMTGVPDLNRPAFDAAEKRLTTPCTYATSVSQRCLHLASRT